MNALQQNYQPLRLLQNNSFTVYKPCKENDTACTNSIRIPSHSGTLHLDTSNIMYCRADGSYSNIYINTSKSICLSKVLKWIGQRLPTDNFIRVHHSYIVNIAMIQSVCLKVRSYIILIDGTRIPISRSKKEFIKNNLSQYIIQ